MRKARGRRSVSFRLDAAIADVLLGALREHERWLHTPAIGMDGAVDAAHQRIYPRAYLDPTEDEAEAHWQSHVHADLAAQKLEAVQAVAIAFEVAPRDRRGVHLEISFQEIDTWCRVLNEVRLRLGVQLDLTDEQQHLDAGPEHEQWSDISTYHVMSELLELLVVASFDESGSSPR